VLALDKISKTISSGEIINFEYALSIQGKQENQFECRMVPCSEDEVLAIVRNISERKKFERRIKESEANARAIMESTSDSFILLDKDGNVIDCNEAHANRLKMTRNEILGKNVFDYLPEELANTRKALVNKVLETGLPSVGEDFRAGFWNEFVINPVFNAEGQVDRVAVFSRDITEKKQFVDLLENQNQILKEKDRIQNTLIANLPGFVYRCANDQNWTMIYISEACEKITGHSPDDFIKNNRITFNDIVHPDFQEPLWNKWQELLKVKGVFREEYQIIHANGDLRWVWEQGRGIFSENDELLFLEGFIEDITQRKQAETLIKNSEKKYRTLFESLSQGIFFQAADGKIIDANDAALRMFGITRDQFLGKDSFDARWEVINENNEILPPEKHPSMVAILTGKPVISQTFGVFIPETGKYTWLIIDAIPQFHPGEARPYQVFASMQDITRRKLAEESLKEAEQRFRTMFERHQAIMLLIQPFSGSIVDANLSASEFYGYSIETLRGMSIDQINCDPPEQIKAERLNALNEKRNYFVFLHKLSNGVTRTVEVHSTPISIGNQELLFSIIHDITQRKKTEIRLQQSEQSLRELNAQKDKFFSIIAHDLKSPFNSIMGFSELLVEQVNDKDYDGIGKYANIIRQSSNRAMDLLLNLLEWSRSQTGRMEFNPEHFEISDFISENVILFDEIAGQKSISMVKKLPFRIPVYADKAMISTVLRNLISNAIKFTKPGGEIIIAATENQTEIVVSVNDNGVGIPQDMLGKLFRIDENYTTSGTNNERGTGLGLILCKEFIEKHSGKIWVESREGEGSTFSFCLHAR
jgi:PAS domain S-box-containing protein